MSQDSSKAPKPPVRLGKYAVLSRIGKGGMGTVYRAVDTDLQRLVALKVLTAEMAGNPVMVERFRREARSAAMLRHENIVSIYEIGEHQSTHFLALEFVDGTDLHEFVIRKGKLDPEEAREILVQAARALDHAHRQGIVHRDIKPSNFLICESGGRQVVKLTDLGLARIKGDVEARLTKDHSTVGTIDFMAPEQAQNSRAADIRSDIYSLGCTLYYMLAGHSPFPRGSIPERIIAHMKIEPVDILKFNDRVPRELASVLKKMLAKKPAERYQSPAELLAALDSPSLEEMPLESADEKSPASVEKSEKAAKKSGFPPASVPLSDQQERGQQASPRSKSKKRPSGERGGKAKNQRAWMVGLGTAGFVAAAAILWLATRQGNGVPVGPEGNPSPQPQQIDTKKDPGPVLEKKTAAGLVGPAAPVYPALYVPTAPLDPVALRKDFQDSAVFPEPAADAVAVTWKRAAGPDEARTLTAALSRAGDKEKVVINIHDNGPLWVPSQELLKNRHVHLRAAPGFRPLIAWDLGAAGAAKGKSGPLLQVAGGSLALEGIDIVVKLGDEAAGPHQLVGLDGASFYARDCTFSVAGKNAPNLTIVKSASDVPTEIHLTRCFLRGSEVRPLVIHGDTEVLLERCLLVGGKEPLVQIVNSGVERTALRLIRSTLIGGQCALSWKVDAGKSTLPGLKVYAWDCILARNDLGASQGDMVLLAGAAKVDQLQWKAVNCLYAGWKRLLHAPDKSIGSGSIAAWRSLWFSIEGDRELNEFWPALPLVESGTLPSHLFRTTDTGACFSASAGPGMLGCEIGAISEGPADWLQRTYERYPAPAFAALEDSGPPVIPSSGDGVFHGEKLDPSKIDLGLYIDSALKTRKAGPKIVLHLTGRGKAPMTPLKISSVGHLVLYFDLPPKGKDEPLTLIPKATGMRESALLEMDGGILEIVNGRFQFPNTRSAVLPASIVKVQDCELRLRGCTLEGAHDRAPDTFQSLIRVDSSPETQKPLPVNVQESVLHGHRRLIDLHGAKLALRIKNTVLLAGEDAMHLHVAEVERPSMTLTLENNTCAVRKRFITVHAPPEAAYPLEPILVQATRNYFLDPYAGEPREASLLAISEEDFSLGRLLWQGKSNAMEEGRWHEFVQGAGKVRISDWQAWWGTLGEQDWKKVDPLPTAKSFPTDAPLFDRLLPPPPHRVAAGAPSFGADLVRLGLIRKKG